MTRSTPNNAFGFPTARVGKIGLAQTSRRFTLKDFLLTLTDARGCNFLMELSPRSYFTLAVCSTLAGRRGGACRSGPSLQEGAHNPLLRIFLLTPLPLLQIIRDVVSHVDIPLSARHRRHSLPEHVFFFFVVLIRS